MVTNVESHVFQAWLFDYFLKRKNLALWTRSEIFGFAVKEVPNPVLPIFSRPYLFRQKLATQYLGFKEFGGDS
jgi:hypothetical protein